jgi:hypothetical protein
MQLYQMFQTLPSLSNMVYQRKNDDATTLTVIAQT